MAWGSDLNPQESGSLGGGSIGLGLPLALQGGMTTSEVHLGPAASPDWTVSSRRAGARPTHSEDQMFAELAIRTPAHPSSQPPYAGLGFPRLATTTITTTLFCSRAFLG